MSGEGRRPAARDGRVARRSGHPARPSLLDRHALADRAVLATGRAYTTLTGLPRSYFSRGVDSESFAEHLAAVRLRPARSWVAGRRAVAAHTIAGPMDAAVHCSRWRSRTAPTLLYHHGGGEVPADRTMRRLLGEAETPSPGAGTEAPVGDGWNVLVVAAPYHERAGEIMIAGAEMRRYLAMMAVSVRLTETLVRTLRAGGARHLRVAGASLGGFVTVRHHLGFDSADDYVPVVAGTAHSDIFLRTFPAARRARRRPETLRRLLDVTDEWRLREHPDVRPVLGRHDPLNLLSVMGPSFEPTPVDVWPRGHLGCIGDRERMAAALFGPARPRDARADG